MNTQTISTEERKKKVVFGTLDISNILDLLVAITHGNDSRNARYIQFGDDQFYLVCEIFCSPYDTLSDKTSLDVPRHIVEEAIEKTFIFAEPICSCCGQEMPMHKKRFHITKYGYEELKRQKETRD